LNLMKHGQTLTSITTEILNSMEDVLSNVKPDLVLVHGDTTTAYATALACFYKQIKVGHVEAGLRTFNKYSPFPEEMNRQMIGIIADYHFAPTETTKSNLISEGKDDNNVIVTGNTSIDVLKYTVRKDYVNEHLKWASDSKLILLTCHRRENAGEPMVNVFKAVEKLVKDNSNIKIIYPIHLNPSIRVLANKHLNHERIRIIEPLDVLDFHNFIANSFLILSDSGGIQEEAPALNKPVLVLRDTTERPEGIEVGTLRLIGTNQEDVYSNTKDLLENKGTYNIMSEAQNPYGDGFASKRIVDFILGRR